MTQLNVNQEKDRKQYLERYYTEKGIEALENRLKSLVELYTKEDTKYPLITRILGFPMLKIFSKEHHQGMIDELSQILGVMNIDIINKRGKKDGD